ncbi:P-loop containing nucleoside triphosphate hydrolase protein [Ilyonectria destructans]|nr:P-loop containing nucleoside triphosphate hydrolase protein [Ilyonectria destructans]
MQARQELDRVVIDECHSVLDSTPQFRPQLLKLGGVVSEWGVQVVCLTATLAIDDQREFFRRTKLPVNRILLFRERTTRMNIRYRVVTVGDSRGKDGAVRGAGQAGTKQKRRGKDKEEADQESEEDQLVCDFVRKWMEKGLDGKVIVYAGSIERVERLGAVLGCPTYWNKVTSDEGKAQRMDAWIAGNRDSGGLIAATNALGMGIDVPDVRLVVHAGMPRRLRNFVQESGRAGRGGKPSVSVVICGKWMDAVRKGKGGKQKKNKVEGAEKDSWDEAALEFVEGRDCRRMVLDRVMDGRMDRWECEEGEERCDVCQRREGIWEEEAVAGVADEGDRGMEAGQRLSEVEEEMAEGSEGLVDAIEEEFAQANRTRAFAQWQTERKVMEEAKEAEEFQELLERWSGYCVVCRMVMGLKEEEEAYHKLEQCPNRETESWCWITEAIGMVGRELFGRKRMQNFSGCFDCGIPQQICNQWEAHDEDGRRFTRVKGAICQYSGLLMELYAGVSAWDQQRADMVVGGDDEDRWVQC